MEKFLLDSVWRAKWDDLMHEMRLLTWHPLSKHSTWCQNKTTVLPSSSDESHEIFSVALPHKFHPKAIIIILKRTGNKQWKLAHQMLVEFINSTVQLPFRPWFWACNFHGKNFPFWIKGSSINYWTFNIRPPLYFKSLKCRLCVHFASFDKILQALFMSCLRICTFKTLLHFLMYSKLLVMQLNKIQADHLCGIAVGNSCKKK